MASRIMVYLVNSSVVFITETYFSCHALTSKISKRKDDGIAPRNRRECTAIQYRYQHSIRGPYASNWHKLPMPYIPLSCALKMPVVLSHAVF